MINVTHEVLVARFNEMAELASAEPKIDVDDPRVLHAARHEQFRGTFFRRFVEIRAVSESMATPSQITYVRMFKERFGYDLMEIPVRHPHLITSIYMSLDAMKPYEQLDDYRGSLLGASDTSLQLHGLAHKLDEATGHPLGVEAIGIYYWDRLNPLLQEAFGVIEKDTINAPFLGR